MIQYHLIEMVIVVLHGEKLEKVTKEYRTGS